MKQFSGNNIIEVMKIRVLQDFYLSVFITWMILAQCTFFIVLKYLKREFFSLEIFIVD